MIKKASELIKALKDCEKHKTLYVMGCFGAPMTEYNKNRYINHDSYNARYDRKEKIMAADKNTFGFDCVCLIKGMFWGWNGNPDDIYGGADYLTDIVPDIDAEQMVNVCNDISTNFDNILPGEVVGMEGHIGVYVGDGLVIECTPKWKDCVQYTALGNKGNKKGYPSRIWDRHGKLPYIKYDVKEEKPTPNPVPKPVVPENQKRYHNEDELPNYAKKYIHALKENHIFNGRENGDLDATDDMVRCLVSLAKGLEKAKVIEIK